MYSRLFSISYPKCIPTLTITQNKYYKCVFPSHKIYDYKYILNVWINESRTNLNLNECCILDYKLNDNVVIHLCFNLIEFIYSWSWKLAVIDFLFEVRLPFWLVQVTVGQNFKLSDRRYWDVGSPLVSRGNSSILFDVGSPLSICRITVFHSDCYSELVYKIIVLPQNFQ